MYIYIVSFYIQYVFMDISSIVFWVIDFMYDIDKERHNVYLTYFIIIIYSLVIDFEN